MSRKPLVLAVGVVCAAGAASLFIPVGHSPGSESVTPKDAVQRIDFSAYSDQPLAGGLDLLFIHHSCGGQLFTSRGPDQETNCIYTSHPEGGGLKSLLEKQGYRVHEASYGSKIGARTDLFDWPPKFRTQMDAILRCELQDRVLPGGRQNQVVMFKSCFPNNRFLSAGMPPGDAAGPGLTVWNAKAAYSSLLEEFSKKPDVLFVCLTAPPLASCSGPQPLWKYMARRILRRRDPYIDTSAPLAREFNSWLAAKDGWLKDYKLKNVVVFDLYYLLTGYGKSNLSFYPTEGGFDSHPNREGNELAAQAFVPFLNRAVNRWRTT